MADLLKFIHTILTCNSFKFHDKFYLQISGTAMGTKMAPNYANLFMGQLEEQILNDAPLKPKVWWRFIDDIFVVWPHGTTTLQTFFNFINEIHDSIKFTYEFSATEIHFLDVTVRLNKDQYSTSIYRKPTDSHSYLRFNSCHPTHCRKSIPYSQAIRLRRICSDHTDFLNQTTVLRSDLINCGYPSNIINKAIRLATEKDRATLLTYRIKDTVDTMNLITTYNPSSPITMKEIKKNWGLLKHHKETIHIYRKRPSITYRRPKNLRDFLVHPDIMRPPRIIGSKPCQSPCVTCPFMDTTDIFQSSSTRITYHIKQDINCQSYNLVYLIQCSKCKIQYVGQSSQTLNKRIIQHRSDITADKETTVAAHFNSHDHSVNDVRVIGIQIVINNSTSSRLATEATWIHDLGTHTPQGLNIKQS